MSENLKGKFQVVTLYKTSGFLSQTVDGAAFAVCCFFNAVKGGRDCYLYDCNPASTSFQQMIAYNHEKK